MQPDINSIASGHDNSGINANGMNILRKDDPMIMLGISSERNHVPECILRSHDLHRSKVARRIYPGCTHPWTLCLNYYFQRPPDAAS